MMAFVMAFAVIFSGAARADEQQDAVTHGRDVFRKNCIVCHPSGMGEGHRNGPDLWGIVGRKVATIPGFVYSDAIKAWGKDLRWDVVALDRFLAAPAQTIPGVRMSFKGLADARQRAELLAFLSTLSGSGDVRSGNQNDRIMPLDWGGLPEGHGRKEVFFTCQACHSLMLVKQQRLSRRVWEETLRWMVSEKKMPEPSPDAREKILDYLAKNFGDATPRASALMMPPPLLPIAPAPP
ncbi:MAG: c-type cytochrome [Magnetococcales bacterium]|nr:c-type cytochrome [Magnetococcales bacterium]